MCDLFLEIKMLSMLKTGLLGLTLSAGMLLAGCQSSGEQAPTTQAWASQAVTCDKCDEVWVKVPTENGKGRIIGYTSRKEMECPACRDAVSNFFATGELKHHCDTCGGNLSICESH
jgi:nitrous oxide reductase accessory protein NosL